MLGDRGSKAVANMLLINDSLFSLNVCSNHISDAGCVCVCGVWCVCERERERERKREREREREEERERVC
jgi:hypothetical protein